MRRDLPFANNLYFLGVFCCCYSLSCLSQQRLSKAPRLAFRPQVTPRSALRRSFDDATTYGKQMGKANSHLSIQFWYSLDNTPATLSIVRDIILVESKHFREKMRQGR